MLLTFVFVLLGAASGFAIYRLGSQRKGGRPQSAALRRVAAVLAFAWFGLSVLLIGWAAWRLAS